METHGGWTTWRGAGERKDAPEGTPDPRAVCTGTAKRREDEKGRVHTHAGREEKRDVERHAGWEPHV